MNRIPPTSRDKHLVPERQEGFVPVTGKHFSDPNSLKGRIGVMVHRVMSPSNHSVTRPPKRYLKARMAPEDVPRETDVLGVGDLHGNVDILYKNLRSLGIISTFGVWTGGNQRLVLLGDIMGDRGVTGLECMRQIDRLRDEARAAGGDITVLAGNHDDIAISYLTRRRIASLPKGKWANYTDEEMELAWNAFGNALISEQWLGIIEFAREYLHFDVKATGSGMKQVRNCWPVALRMMREDPEGMAMLQNICQMQLAEHIDDTLFIHTEPTPEIVQMIHERGIDSINEIYQEGLRNILLENTEPSPDFRKVVDVFLYVYNREDLPTDEETAKLRERGINRIIHWHINTGGLPIYIGGLDIHSIDHSAGRKSTHPDVRSICRIKTNGILVNGRGR